MMEYKIIRSRRKSLAIEITPQGDLLVRAPLRIAKRDIERFVKSRQAWIDSHLSNLPVVTPLTSEEHQALVRRARQILPEKAAHYAALMGVDYSRITIRSQRTRWGSCSASGNLSFNCLMMLAPEEIQDYVIIHELCHRKQMNHSPAFWAEVGSICPDFRRCRAWLKANGAVLMARLPDVQK